MRRTILLYRSDGGDRARIPRPWSFLSVARARGAKRCRTAPFGGGDHVHRFVIACRLGSDFATVMGDRTINADGIPIRAAPPRHRALSSRRKASRIYACPARRLSRRLAAISAFSKSAWVKP